MEHARSSTTVAASVSRVTVTVTLLSGSGFTGLAETLWNAKQRFAEFALFVKQGEDEYSLGDNKE